MNGYTLTYLLRTLRDTHAITAVEQALFYELVALCNESGWAASFPVSNMQLARALCVSENTLMKARRKLIALGILSYQSGKSNRTVGIYSIASNFEVVADPTTSKFEVAANFEVAKIEGEEIVNERSERKLQKTPTSNSATSNSAVAKIEDSYKHKHTTTARTREANPFFPSAEELLLGYGAEQYVVPELWAHMVRWVEHLTTKGDVLSPAVIEAVYSRLRKLSGIDNKAADDIVTACIAANAKSLFLPSEMEQQGSRKAVKEFDPNKVVM